MSLKQVERLSLVGCGFKGRLVRLLSRGMGLHNELEMPVLACRKLMHSTVLRVASKLPGVFRDKVAKEAEELCAAGQCAAALVPLQQAIYLGDLPSRALNAWLLIDGRAGVARNQEKAFGLVDEGARLGCHHCEGVMAHCHVFGHGCKKNYARSLELARLSSKSCSRYGQYTLGWLHQFGKAGLSADRAQAVACYQLAASQGLDKAQRALGQTRTFGTLDIDSNEGRRWLQLAVAQDDRLESESERDSDWDDPYEGDGPWLHFWHGARPPRGWIAPPGFLAYHRRR
jgi:TPR repeat protein